MANVNNLYEICINFTGCILLEVKKVFNISILVVSASLFEFEPDLLVRLGLGQTMVPPPGSMSLRLFFIIYPSYDSVLFNKKMIV